MCEGMAQLARLANLITPNITEAAILLGMAPSAAPAGEAETMDWVARLSMEGRRSVALTGFPGNSPDRRGLL
jgi:pyridoxine kinase